MDDVEFDDMMTRARNPNLIPGIYNYCDYRCGRCPFTGRCLSFLERRRSRHDDAEPAGSQLIRSLGDVFEMLQIIARREGIDLAVPADELAAAEIEEDERQRLVQANPAVVLAQRYHATAAPIVVALAPIVAERGDADVIGAVDRIGELSGLIASKVFRAAYGALDQPDEHDDGIQNDRNGSVKIARLMIAESQSAWRVLMEAGRATANGVPAQLVKLLCELDAILAAQFPRAMAFVRPGFDEPPAVVEPAHADAEATVFSR